MADVKYEDYGIVTFPFYDENFPETLTEIDEDYVELPTLKFTDFGYPDIDIRGCPPPAWTLASELSEQKRIEFTSHAQSMLDHYNKIKDTNFEFVRLVRVQTYLGRGDDHYIQFEVKPRGAADHTLKTFEAAVYEESYPTPGVFPLTCGLVDPNYGRDMEYEDNVEYEHNGFVTFPFYDQDFPDMQSEPVQLPVKKFTDFGLPDLDIRVRPPPAWTLASELSEQKRIEFTSHAQSMLDHYNKIKDTNFEFVRLVRVQTYLGRGDDHYIQFEAKPSVAADHTLKTFEAAIYEQFYPTPEVFPVTCGLVVPKR